MFSLNLQISHRQMQEISAHVLHGTNILCFRSVVPGTKKLEKFLWLICLVGIPGWSDTTYLGKSQVRRDAQKLVHIQKKVQDHEK